jgi:hypothetical protein
MILRHIRLGMLGVVLAALAAPALAAAPAGTTPVDPNPAAGSQRADASRARRVELPFPLDFRAPDREPPAPALRQDAGPHPFRESLLKRASLTDSAATVLRDGRLSPHPDFV